MHANLRCFLRAVYGNVVFFTVFSESRLWDCRVFTVFAYRQVRFDCIFTGFADDRLWEYRIFSFKKACLAQKSQVFLRIFHLFLFLEALQGFVRLWQVPVLEGFGKFWEALEGSAGFAKLCKALGGLVGRS